MGEYISMQNINKVYRSSMGEVKALDNACLEVRKGSVHGLLGENGAGKTTLMKILSGLEQKDSGDISYGDKTVSFRNTMQAAKAGIGMVHQHFSLIDEFTVTQNVMLGMEPLRHGFIDEKQARQRVVSLAEDCGFSIDPDARISRLTMGQRQAVEIIRLLYSNTDVLIFDEPTSMLVEQEISSLHKTLGRLKDEGKTIIYISHKVEEMFAIADEVTVLRNGADVLSSNITDTTPAGLVSMMVGKTPVNTQHNAALPVGKRLLQVTDLWVKSGGAYAIKGVDMEIAAGEIVALAGVNGNGQKELLDALFGLQPAARGVLTLDGKPITSLSPRQRRQQGVGYIPEDRNNVGSCRGATIAENMLVDRFDEYGKHGWLSWKAIRQMGSSLMVEYNIQAPGPDSYVDTLSGGNVQKALLARELSRNPRLLLACEVTMGLDVEATANIHDMLLKLRQEGAGIFLVSSNMGEILRLADSIYVMHAGEITARLNNDGTIDRAEIGEYMLGLKRQPKYAAQGATNGQG